MMDYCFHARQMYKKTSKEPKLTFMQAYAKMMGIKTRIKHREEHLDTARRQNREDGKEEKIQKLKDELEDDRKQLKIEWISLQASTKSLNSL